MNYFEALILGIVEGLTEFVPVSSTGHLILTSEVLRLDAEAMDSYVIVIQLGAILAVLALYKDRTLQMLQGVMGANPQGLKLFLRLFVAFLPAVFVGLTLESLIDEFLFHVAPVAGALMVGGVAMIAVEKFHVQRWQRLYGEGSLRKVEDMTYRDAVLIGLAQCLALWPGTSRSMATIVGGQLCGFHVKDAAEISFLLALPTLGGATVYKLIKDWDSFQAMDGGLGLVLFGNVVAFVVAYFAVKTFVRIVTRYGMTPFGIYRILIGSLFLWLWATGWLAF